jgi:hypothetical protein
LPAAFAKVATTLAKTLSGLASPPSEEGAFVMSDQLMLFLALALGFTVVLVEWWARRTP